MGNVLVEMLPQETQSDGGIHIPDVAQEKSQLGVVVEIGIWRPNRKGNLMPYDFQRGDKILVNRRAGRWIHGEAGKLKLIPAEKVLAKFSDLTA